MYCQVPATCTVAKFSFYGTMCRQVPAACIVAKFCFYGTMYRQVPATCTVAKFRYGIMHRQVTAVLLLSLAYDTICIAKLLPPVPLLSLACTVRYYV
jgi:hypothetical protein